MTVATAVSRLTGFVRTWAMAVALGVTLTASGSIPVASSYAISNNIPNMVYELLAGGVLSSMLIPIFMEKRERDGEQAAFAFANTLFSVALVLLGAMALLGTLWPDPFVRTQTFTVSRAESELAIHLFRFFAVQIVFYAWCAIATGVLNGYRRFLAPAIAPIANNVVVIVVLLGFYLPMRESAPSVAVTALGVGTTLGVVAMFATQVPALLKLGFRFRWTWDLTDPSLRKMARKTVPVIVFVIVNLIAVSFRNAYATQAFRDGSAALQYAWMWYQLPYGLLAVSYTVALFPELSASAERRDWGAYKTQYARGLRVIGALTIPMAAMLIALAAPLVTLYRAGAFPADAVPLVSLVLQVWAGGLFSFAAYMLTLRAFHAMQDSRTPMLTNLVAAVVHIALYWYLTGPAGLGLAGIPAADAIHFTLHLAALMVILRLRVGGFDGRAAAWSLARVAVASAAGGAAAYGASVALAGLGGVAGSALARVLAGGVAGLAVTYGLAVLLRVPEMADAASLVRRVAGRAGLKGAAS